MAVADFAQGVTSSNYWAAHLHSIKPQPKDAVTASADTSTDKPLITTGADGKSFFENVLDIVNPLEHLPVVSTIYHALTGNKSGDLEKMAGDTLYGGPIGLVSSVADIAFQKITGKSFGDTMLAMVGMDGDDNNGKSDKNTALAANTQKSSGMETAATAALNKASLAPATRIAQTTKSMPVISTASPMASIATAAPAPLRKPSAPAIQTASTIPAPAPAAASAQNVVDISPQTNALLEALQKNGVTGAMQNQAMDAYRRTMTMNTQQNATVH